MILYIDSTDFDKVTFALAEGRAIKKSYKIDSHHSHGILEKLEEFLKYRKAKTSDIQKIITNKGPGSFTGTRVGVAHTLALGFALGVPVTFVSTEKFKIR
jgi:tRNA threonylcarbamoyladenosine biosynthesis protein TsaB